MPNVQEDIKKKTASDSRLTDGEILEQSEKNLERAIKTGVKTPHIKVVARLLLAVLLIASLTAFVTGLMKYSELQREKDGGAAVGTEENLEAAAALLDNVLLDTQSTSLLSDRSALARDKNEFAKMLSMFRNEAVKAFSNFYGAIGSYYDHKRLGEKDGMLSLISAHRRGSRL